MPPHRVVIAGGGFAGLRCAQALKGPSFDVTLIDRRNFHLFQPLLYQVATGGLSPADISTPLREVFKRQRNVRVLLGEVVDFDLAGRRVVLGDGEVAYDSLVVATGVSPHYFGHNDWAPRAPGLKSLEDATEIRRRVLWAFEAAEREADSEARRAWLTFVIVGGGPTGVELAGTLGELRRDTLRRDFRSIDPAEASIHLLEGSERILETFHPKLSRRAERDLARLGVTVRTGCRAAAVEDGRVEVKRGDEIETIRTHTVLWAAGVKASPLGRLLAERTGAKTDGAGRVHVEPDLSLPGRPEVFVAGDLARLEAASGRPLPGVAPVAMQQGRYIARLLRARCAGKPSPPFRYRDRGNLATIGRSRAVAELGRMRFAGFPAWLLWLFVHLLQLVGFENRLLVLLQWAWNYLTWNRSARLITGSDERPLRVLRK
jgi:NADH dehydrogenase